MSNSNDEQNGGVCLLRQGEAGNAIAIARMLQAGLQPFVPSLDTGTDLAVEIDGRFVRLQVKTSSFADKRAAKGARRFSLRRSTHNQGKRDYESETPHFFLCVSLPSEDIFVVPFAALKGRKGRKRPGSITIRSDDSRKNAWHLLQKREYTDAQHQ